MLLARVFFAFNMYKVYLYFTLLLLLLPFYTSIFNIWTPISYFCNFFFQKKRVVWWESREVKSTFGNGISQKHLCRSHSIPLDPINYFYTPVQCRKPHKNRSSGYLRLHGQFPWDTTHRCSAEELPLNATNWVVFQKLIFTHHLKKNIVIKQIKIEWCNLHH